MEYRPTKSELTTYKSLKDKKGRENAGLFLVEGSKSVLELLNSDLWVQIILFTEAWAEKPMNKAALDAFLKKNMPLGNVSSADLNKISALSTSPEILAVVEIPNRVLPEIPEIGWTIMLEQISDPGNLGTILRTADWFGIKQVICSNESVDYYNPKVIQSSMGSFTRVGMFETDLQEILKKNKSDKNIPVFGAVLNGSSALEIKLPEKGILLLGNESRGISHDLIPFISKAISIPKGNPGVQTESLNVSTAAGIFMSLIHKPQL